MGVGWWRLQGSGKTLAFGLPILQRLVAGGGGAPGLPDRSPLPPSDLRCLVLLPTRELALQVGASASHAGAAALVSTAVQMATHRRELAGGLLSDSPRSQKHEKEGTCFHAAMWVWVDVPEPE